MNYPSEKKEIIDCLKSLGANVDYSKDNYFGYHCIFAPEEIIHAAGFVPIRLFPTCSSIYDADKEQCFHSRTCEFAKRLLENFSSGKLNFLQGVVFAQCCDALRALYEVINGKTKNIFYINTPIANNDDSLIADKNIFDFFVQELVSFSNDLANAYNLQLTSESLLNSIDVYHENHSLLSAIEEFYKKGLLATLDYLHIRKSGYFIRKEVHNSYLRDLLSVLKKEDASNSKMEFQEIPILLSGNINGDCNWVEYLEKMGARVVAEDLCCFSRNNTINEKDKQNPFRLLALENLTKNCPIKIGVKNRFDKLYAKYLDAGAKGIIFFIFQYCDAQYMDYSQMKSSFAEKNIPTLVINPSVFFNPSAQMETRIEAFFEMVRNNE